MDRRTALFRALIIVSLMLVTLGQAATAAALPQGSDITPNASTSSAKLWPFELQEPLSPDLACDYQPIVLADNPIAYWRLGEATGTTAANIGSLGAAVDGTYQNGVTLGMTGLVANDTNTAAGFDGADDFVSIPSHGDINMGGPYTVKTVELWFKANVTVGRQLLFEQGGAINGLNLFLDGDQLYVGVWASDTGVWVNTTVAADNTYHVTLVFDGGTQTLTGYLNGASFGSLPTPFDSIPFHDGTIAMGAIDEGTRYPSGVVLVDPTGDHLNGTLDEMALYNTVLSPERIAAHAAGCGGTCYDLTLSHTGQGTDPVASPLNSDGCPAGQYVEGEQVDLSGADPALGWEIGGWTGTDNNASTAATNTLTMPASAHAASVNYEAICYELTLSHTGQGTDPVAAPTNSVGCAAGLYHYGEDIDLTADPDTGWEVSSWTGTDNNSSTAETNTLTMPASAHAASVNYEATCYALTLSHTGMGTDPVAAPTNSVGCAAGFYHYGEDIDLSGAVPDTGWEIGGWTGTDNNSSTAAINTLTMPASAHAASVNYEAICYELALSHTGQGTDPVAAPTNSAGCAAGFYHYGEDIDLTADPDTGWEVSGWTGTDNNSSTAETNTLTMPASAHAASVNYDATCYELTLSHTGQGTDPVAFPDRSTGCAAGFYHYQEYIELSGAAPALGWEISGWTGTDNNGSTATTNALTMPASAHVASVNYSATCYALTLSHTGQGADPVATPANSVGCTAGFYHYGEDIDLTADPALGWEVAGWTGTDNNSSTAETNTLTMPASAHAASVNYEATCYALTLSHTGMGADPVAAPTNSAGCAAGFYHYGEDIDLSGAAPSLGWEISGWTATDNDASTAATNTLTMPASAHAASVNYSATCYALTLSHTGQGADPVAAPTNSVGCAAGLYHYEEEIDLTADPALGWEISGWTGTDNNGSTADTNTLTMPASAHAASVNYEATCYELTLSHTGQGTDPVAAPTNSAGCAAGFYHYGEDIDLSGAAPALGWEIGGWTATDNDASTAATNTLTMPASAHAASVNYEAICYELTLSHTGQGTDPVAAPTNSVGCSAGFYHYEESIDLTADPDTGWEVSSWTGTDNNSSTAETNTLTMPASAHAASVNYEATCHELTLSHTGQGTDPVAAPTNSAGCAAGFYHYGEDIDLSGAAPALGWEIGGWTGTDNDASTAAINTLTMPASAHAASVNYSGTCYELALSHTGQGTDPVAAPTSSIGCAAGFYYYGEDIDLTADPDLGWRVSSWTGTDNDSSAAETNTLTMPASAHAASVNYEAIPQYTLTVTKSGYGSIALDPPGGIYYEGTVVTLTPTADPGWSFIGWAGPNGSDVVDNGDGTWSLTMDGNKEVTARFVLRIYMPIIFRGATP